MLLEGSIHRSHLVAVEPRRLHHLHEPGIVRTAAEELLDLLGVREGDIAVEEL
jgi:hypothetical protein